MLCVMTALVGALIIFLLAVFYLLSYFIQAGWLFIGKHHNVAWKLNLQACGLFCDFIITHSDLSFYSIISR